MRFVILIFLISQGLVSHGQNPDSLKCWQTNSKLTWEDFKSEVPSNRTNERTNAICPNEIIVKPYRKNGVLNFTIKVVFLKNEAWAIDKSTYALLHEQLHFDITELHARKLRKALKQIRPSSEIADYQATIETHLSANNEMQREFDNQTAHGIYSSIQAEWSKNISKELDSLRHYASNEKDCVN